MRAAKARDSWPITSSDATLIPAITKTTALAMSPVSAPEPSSVNCVGPRSRPHLHTMRMGIL